MTSDLAKRSHDFDRDRVAVEIGAWTLQVEALLPRTRGRNVATQQFNL
jgi:hypothetical protein